MASGTCFRVDNKHVAHEIFDGEILAVNVNTGTYYSLTGVSAKIWECILSGATTESITQALSDIYVGERIEIEAAVASFIEQLSRESLIIEDQTSNGATAIQLRGGGEVAQFTAPSMEIFSDMQDLLLLDPIHEVDDTGWPMLKPGPDHATVK